MKMTKSEMYCTQCGKRNIPVQRKIGQEREPGHLKRMWCIHCRKEVNMVEIKEKCSGYTYEDFRDEFNWKNFDKDGNRRLSLSDFKIKMNSIRREAEEKESCQEL